MDNYSRVNTIPCADLLDREGNKVMTIQESDFSQLKAAGTFCRQGCRWGDGFIRGDV